VLFLIGGSIAMMIEGQNNSICGTSLLVNSSGGEVARKCDVAAVGYNGGLALVILGAVLLIGAFLLTIALAQQPDEKAPKGFYLDPSTDTVRWWDGASWGDFPPPPT
jgi:hypothetical protein